MLRCDEADLFLATGNVRLVAWPVAALALARHAMARSRFKGLRGAAGLVEEVG